MQERRQRSLGRRIADWWSNCWGGRKIVTELGSADHNELERIVADLGMTVAELCAAAQQGDRGADLLYRRMAGLGLDAKEVAERATAAMLDMRRGCVICNVRGRCEPDLSRAGRGRAGRDYCVNVKALEALVRMAKVGSSHSVARAQWPSAISNLAL